VDEDAQAQAYLRMAEIQIRHAERQRIIAIIEARLSAWSGAGAGTGGGNAPLLDRIVVKDALTDLLAAIKEQNHG
jgi:hypothetical protein